MKILITGHLGFVGKHFCDYLSRDKNNEVVGVDIKSGVDCRDYFKTCTDKFDLIIHLAAVVGGRETIEGSPLSVATDLSIDSEFFNWVINTKQPRVVYFSSSAAYPTYLQNNRKSILKEEDLNLEDIHNPDESYGWSKLTGEFLAEYARREGVKVHVFRPFSGFGEWQDLTYPVPMFIERVIKKEDPFEIWGDGEQVRDFIYIKDIVQAVMKAVELDIEGPVNLGSGVPISFNSLAQIIFTVAGWSPSKGIKHLLHKPVGVGFRCGDPSLLKTFYTLQYSLEDAIAIMLQERMLHA